MRKKVIGWLFTLQSQRGILGEKERKLYTYAYSLLLNKIAIYAIIAIIGTMTGNWIEMFSFLLPFTVLRQYAGGIHLKKSISCICFSGFLVFICGKYLALNLTLDIIFYIIWVIAIMIIFLLVPVDTGTKRLDEVERKIYGKCARKLLIIELTLALCFDVTGVLIVARGIAVAHIILASGLMLGKGKNFLEIS